MPLLLSESDSLDIADFRLTAGPEKTGPESLNLEANERRMITEALENAGGNISHAAAALGITRASLYRRIEKFEL